jgi:hypothetical protein
MAPSAFASVESVFHRVILGCRSFHGKKGAGMAVWRTEPGFDTGSFPFVAR